MGTCYYLARDDNRTLFELGKHTGDWGDVLGRGNPTWLTEPTADMALALEVISLDAGWTESDLSVHGRTPDGLSTYIVTIVDDIKRWADGQPFRFVHEDGFDGWQFDDSWDYATAITGSRYVRA